MHTLKIDQSFIEGLGKEPEDAAIVAAIVQLGHALGLSVTAEGRRDDPPALGAAFARLRPRPGLLLRATRSPAQIVRALVHHRFRWRQRDPAA